MIGQIGFDCSRFTYREILEIWVGAMGSAWDRSSSIMAATVNCHAKKPYQPDEFNPFSEGSSGGQKFILKADQPGAVQTLAAAFGVKNG